MSRQKNKKKRTKAYLLFYTFAVLIAIQIAYVFFMSLYVKNKMQNIAEKHYHSMDLIYANQFVNHEDAKERTAIEYAPDDNCYVGVIDIEGNVIDFQKGKNISISVSNIYKLLYSSRIIKGDYDSTVNAISAGASGRVEFYNANQSKIMIYTPVGDGEHAIVRIIPKKVFIALRDVYASDFNLFSFGTAVLAICILVAVHKLATYTLNIETSNERHELIAADNDLVSFTYHSSIANFEMTGAVSKIFGDEIAKRNRLDWNSLSILLHPDDQPLLRNMSKAIKSGEAKYTTEFRMKGTNGEYSWYRLNGKSITNEAGDVTKFVGTIQNSDDQIAHENMLKNKAEHDLLTGLLNKITIEESVNEAIRNCTHGAFSFFIIDLDNFKAVNDNLGHAVGDKVLTDVASKLQLVFNETDYIGRLGGDEFAVLLVIPHMMVSQAEKLTREKATLLNEILRTEYGDENITIRVSASIGVAAYPDNGTDFQALYRNGDKALYHSKEHGKDQFTFYNSLNDSEK